jgi:hypothetical protein
MPTELARELLHAERVSICHANRIGTRIAYAFGVKHLPCQPNWHANCNILWLLLQGVGHMLSKGWDRRHLLIYEQPALSSR